VTRVASFENTDSIGKALSRNWWQLMWPVPSRTTNQEVAGLQSFLFKDGTDLLKEAQIERFDLEERGWKPVGANCPRPVVSQWDSTQQPAVVKFD
jgi:hypothetical protein